MPQRNRIIIAVAALTLAALAAMKLRPSEESPTPEGTWKPA